jgi:hypothetical protein
MTVVMVLFRKRKGLGCQGNCDNSEQTLKRLGLTSLLKKALIRNGDILK